MSVKRASLKGAKGLLENIPERQQKNSQQQHNTSDYQEKPVKWRKVTVRFEENFFLNLKRKLKSEGRTMQGYIEYLIRRDLEEK